MGITIDHGSSLADIACGRYSKSNGIQMKKTCGSRAAQVFAEAVGLD